MDFSSGKAFRRPHVVHLISGMLCTGWATSFENFATLSPET
jgi:hypothetical protein